MGTNGHNNTLWITIISHPNPFVKIVLHISGDFSPVFLFFTHSPKGKLPFIVHFSAAGVRPFSKEKLSRLCRNGAINEVLHFRVTGFLFPLAFYKNSGIM